MNNANQAYAQEAQQLLEDIGEDRLTVWEKDFVENMRGRIEKYGDGTYVSDKQIEALRRIAEK